jgi:hypothetical protein
MMMRTVTLELLRHGPAHNQLLSPLTPYLALCGNHDAETVNVGFEHLQLMRRIEQLRYMGGARMASMARGEAAQEVTRLLASIHSLTAELSTSDPEEERRMVHLRLVLSASELSLLPFEMANAYSGLAAQEQPLCLQTARPVCLTRETRRVAATTLEWPKDMHILVIAAAPPQVSAIPLREHLQVLRAALDPYMVKGDEEELARYVTVIPEATLAAVRRACSTTRFTHVHVLAHGIGADDGGEARFGLAFHAEGQPNMVDVVTGSRLAAALRCHTQGHTGQELSSPVVLTIASCDSANLGTVLAPGASVAHELHEAGIPLVIGSQFPLSVKGSVVMTELLYRRLLQGDDPRVVTHDLRQALHAECRDTHDWASVVVYAALPGDLESQLERVRFERAHQALDTVMSRIDAFAQEGPLKDSVSEVTRLELKAAMKRFKEVAPTGGKTKERRVQALGVLANASKRVAWFMRPPEEGAPVPTADKVEASHGGDSGTREYEYREALEDARRYYYACYQEGVRDPWPLVQYLALTMALERGWNGEDFRNRWTAACVMARDAQRSENIQRQALAHSSLVELMVIAAGWLDPKQCEQTALKHAQEFYELTRLDLYNGARFDMYSLYRQILRYEKLKWGTPEVIALSKTVGEALLERGARRLWTHSEARQE